MMRWKSMYNPPSSVKLDIYSCRSSPLFPSRYNTFAAIDSLMMHTGNNSCDMMPTCTQQLCNTLTHWETHGGRWVKQCGPDDFISTDIFKFWLSTAQSSLAFISLFLSAPLKSRRKHDRGLTPSGLHFTLIAWENRKLWSWKIKCL